MFEQSLQTTEWKESRDHEGRSEDEVKGRRLAAYILAVNAALAAAVAILVTGGPPPLLGIIVAFALAIYLYKLRPRAEELALGLTIISAVFFPAIGFWKLQFFEALLQSIGNWGVSGALLLLLIGAPSAGRRALAVIIFALVACGYYALLVVSHLLSGS